MSGAAASTRPVLVDVAGAAMGGAQRYVNELDRWLLRSKATVQVVGRGRRLGAGWLASREAHALRGRSAHVVATNNVSFCLGGEHRTVLLRNALHFLSPEEAARVLPLLPSRQEKEAGVVRAAMRRADRIVVPTTTMGQRVVAHCPWAEDRLAVLPHPLTPLANRRRRRPRSRPPVLLCPVLNAPYKDLGSALRDLQRATARDSYFSGLELRVTCEEHELERLGVDQSGRIIPLGRLSSDRMTGELLDADVIFFPMQIESFGYPLAEARVNRIPVVAPATEQAREVAGDALVGCKRGEPESIAAALDAALDLDLAPLGENPFDPDRYFANLLRLDVERVPTPPDQAQRQPSRGRRVLEDRTHRLVLLRRLPDPYRSTRIYVSSEGGLRYLRPSLGSADPPLLALVRELVAPGSTVWDVGANVGLFTLAAATASGPGGFVLAVEPDAWLVNLLRRSARLPSNRSLAQIDVLCAAAAQRAGVVRFHIARRSRSTSYLEGFGTTQTGGSREVQLVPTVTLDQLSEQAPLPDVLKIDVEAAEALVLQGAARVLEHGPIVVCEVASSNAAPVSALLRGFGYRFYDGAVGRDQRREVPSPPDQLLAIRE